MPDDSGVRTGRVSSINYSAGTARVTYADKDGTVTKEVPFVANNEYNMPKVGDMVSVTCNSNGTVAATIGGSTWNDNNRPYEGYEGLYRKEYSNTKNKCFERYDDATGEYLLRVNRLCRRQAAEIYDEATGKVGITAGSDATVKSTGASVGIQAKTGVGINGGKNVTIEAGKDISAEAGGSISISAGQKWMRTIKGTSTDTFTGAATETYKSKRTVTVAGAAADTFKAARSLTVKGKYTATITGKITLMAKAATTATFKGAVTATFKGKRTEKVEGDYQLKVGATTLKIAKPGDVELKTGGTTVSIAVSGAVTIDAAPTLDVTAPNGDITIKGVSLLHHKHKDGGQGEPEQ